MPAEWCVLPAGLQAKHSKGEDILLEDEVVPAMEGVMHFGENELDAFSKQTNGRCLTCGNCEECF